ncbi:hypothetical protein GCM10028825_45860 [Spirosoma agri]
MLIGTLISLPFIRSIAQSTLALTQPTYNCATGAITFNTTGGNGSLITYTAPGTTRSSVTSNTGVVEAGLRNDPKPILIQATQSGYTASYTFDLAGACAYQFKPPVLAQALPDQTFTVGQVLKQENFNLANYITDPTPGQPRYFPEWTASMKGLPAGISQNSYGDLRYNLNVSLVGSPTTSGVYTVTVTAATQYFPNQPVTTTFKIKVVDPSDESTLKLGLPTYNCATGAITFLTTGGDGSLITYTAPGITRSSVTSNTGVVEAGLRNDPKPILIQATQSGYTASYTFDLRTNCIVPAALSPVLVSPINNLTLTIGKALDRYHVGQHFTDPNPHRGASFYPISFNAANTPPGLYFVDATLSSTGEVSAYFSGAPTKPGIYTVTVTSYLFGYITKSLAASGTFTLTVVDSSGTPPKNAPLTLAAPTYDCTTGAISFNTSGGDGSPVEFKAIGITDWTTNPNQFVDNESRTATDVQPFTLMARQGEQLVSYSWNLKAACGRARMGVSEVVEAGSGLSLQLLGNPVQELLRVRIRGAEGQSVELRLTDSQGRLLQSRTVERVEAVEEQHFQLNQPGPNMLLLQATTQQQVQTVKVLKQ